MKLFLILSLFQQPDPVCFNKYARNADTLAKVHLPSTQLTGYQKRARARLDSLLNQKCVTAPAPTPTPPPDTQPPPAPTPGVAELPRTVPAYRDPYPGRLCSVTVPSASDVSSALAAARGGSVVCLQSGGVYGPVTLPTRTAGDTGWIVVRTSGSLPAEGTRATPSTAATFAKIHVTTNATCAIATAPNADGYYVRGLEVRAATTVTLTYDFVCLRLPDDVAGYTSADVPQRLIFAQVYVHGHATHEIQNCFKINSASTAVVDSWIGECHMRGVESHGVSVISSPGPLLFLNNHIEAQSINLLVGGATPKLAQNYPPLTGLRASDITIRRNHFYTPGAWKGVWYPRKNHLELKNAARVLIEANVFDGSWEEASHGGVPIVLKSINDEGTCTWCQTSDVTLRWNQAKNIAMGLGINGQECYASTGCTIWPPVAARIRVTENVFDIVNAGTYTGYGRGMQLGSGATDLMFDRNVMAGTTTVMLMTFWDKPVDRVTFRDNVFAMGLYALHVDPGGGYLADGVKNAVWERMTLVGTENPNRLPPSTVVTAESQAPLAAQIRATVTAAVSGVVLPP